MLMTFMVVWAVVIVAWRTQHRMPDTGDIGLYLLGLPLGIFALILLVKHYSPRFGQASVTPSESEQMGSAHKTETDKLGDSAAQAPLRHASILDAALVCVHGTHGQEIIHNHRSSLPTLTLDEVLTDSDGYPIVTGRIQNLETEDTWQSFMEWQSSTGAIAQPWLDEDIRAIALGTQVITDLSDTFTQLAQVSTQPQTVETAGRAKSPHMPLHLQLFTYFPARWSTAQRTTVAQWLTHQLHQYGWGPERIQVTERAQNSLAMPSDALHDYIQACAQHPTPPVGLIMSCMSNIGEHSANQWEQYTPRLKTQSGHALSEAAASMLLWTSEVALTELGRPTTQIFPIRKSLHEGRKVMQEDQERDALSKSMQAAAAAANIPHDQITFVVADGCQDSHQAIELATSTQSLFSQLDWNEHIYRVSSACGDLEATSDLLSKVIGHQLVIHDDAITNVLCIQHRDTNARHSVVIAKNPQPTKYTI